MSTEHIGWEYAITRISNGKVVGKPLPSPLALTMRHNDMPNKHRYRISKRPIYAGEWMHGDGDERATGGLIGDGPDEHPAWIHATETVVSERHIAAMGDALAARYAHGYQEDAP